MIRDLILLFLITGVMQASTQAKMDKRYSPSFKEEGQLHRRPSGSKRKREEVLRLVFVCHLNFFNQEIYKIL